MQIVCVCSISLVALRLGERALNSWLCLVAVSMNLFVIKQIHLMAWDVTSTDALAVGYILGLALIQEYFGKKAARAHILISFLVSGGFTLLSYIQLIYVPNKFDLAQPHLTFIFASLPRLIFASLTSFILIQFIDIHFFGVLRQKWKGRFFTQRALICCAISQVFDTFIFTFLGLYGLVEDLGHIILVSLIIKIAIIFISAPFMWLASFCSPSLVKNLPR